MKGKVKVKSSGVPTRETKDPTLNTPGHDNKYGLVYVENKSFHPGEPVFVIRASDPRAPGAIRGYAELCEAAGCSNDHIISSLTATERVQKWQEENPTLVKEKSD